MKNLQDEKKCKPKTEESKNKKQKIDATESQEMITTAWFEKLPVEIWVQIFSNLELKKLLRIKLVSSFFKTCVDDDKNNLIDNALRRRATELVKIATALDKGPEAIKNLDTAISYIERVSKKNDQDYQDIFDFHHEKVVNYLLNNATIMDRNNLSDAFRAIPEKKCIDFFYAASNEHELGRLYVKENNLPKAMSCFHENLNYRFQYAFGYLILENNFLVEDIRFLYESDFKFFKHHQFDSMEYHIYSLMCKWVSSPNANMKNLVNSFASFKLKDIKNSTLLLHLYEFILYIFSIDEKLVANDNLDNAHIFQSFLEDEDSQQTFEQILEELKLLIDEEPLQTRYSWQYSQEYLIDQETENETTAMICN